MSEDATPDWQEWLGRWDAMQMAYLPFREDRFTVMLDAVVLPASSKKIEFV